MYSTCLFCKNALGSNEVIEAFPIGRRLAFDAEKGRLWVACTRCERWNLTLALPPAHAEEVYNAAVHGRSPGGRLRILEPAPR